MKKLVRSEKGQGLVEYALILVLVAIVVLAVLLLMGPTVGNAFSNIVANLQRFSGGGSGPITGLSVQRVVGNVNVTVNVSSDTSITVSATSGNVTAPPTRNCTAGVPCTFNVTGVNNPSTGTVTASGGGGSVSANWN
jgi:pilus assembly protein Flp/PilA